MDHAWVGTEWVTPGWVRNGSRLGGYAMGHVWVGTQWVTPGRVRNGSRLGGYGMNHAWVTEDDSKYPFIMFWLCHIINNWIFLGHAHFMTDSNHSPHSATEDSFNFDV